MPLSTCDRFAQWIAHARANRHRFALNAPTFAITLSPATDDDASQLGDQLIEYLNEFDENAGGHWQAFDDEALETIGKHTDPHMLPELPLLSGIARLGTAVLIQSKAHLVTQGIPRVFHVKLTHHDTGESYDDTRSFHLLLNRARFEHNSLISIIGDSALEWARLGHDPADRVVPFER